MNYQPTVMDLSKINLSSIEVTSFEVRNYSQKTLYKRDIKGAQFKFKSEFGYNLEEKSVYVSIFTNIEAVPYHSIEEDVGGSCAIEFIFNVDNLDKYFEGEESDIPEKKFGIDASFVHTLLGLSFSTARGIVYSRSLGTMLDGILLPIIPPKELLSTSQ